MLCSSVCYVFFFDRENIFTGFQERFPGAKSILTVILWDKLFFFFLHPSFACLLLST